MEVAVGLVLWLDRWRTSSIPAGLKPLKEVVPPKALAAGIPSEYIESKVTDSLDDMHTEDLPGVLAGYLSACSLYHSAVETDLEKRRCLLMRCRDRIRAWVKRTAGFISSDKVSDEWLSKLDQLTLQQLTPEDARSKKMAQKREIRALEESLEVPACYLANLRHQESGTLWSSPGDEEEECRAFWQGVIDLAMYDALDNLAFLQTEIDVLEHLIKAPAQAQPPPARRPLQFQTFKSPGELQQYYQKQVFQVPYELPSQSLAEVAAKEMAYEVGQLGAAQKRTQEHADESSDSEPDDAAERKARDWDDWKDENPKGSGNLMVNRG